MCELQKSLLLSCVAASALKQWQCQLSVGRRVSFLKIPSGQCSRTCGGCAIACWLNKSWVFLCVAQTLGNSLNVRAGYLSVRMAGGVSDRCRLKARLKNGLKLTYLLVLLRCYLFAVSMVVSKIIYTRWLKTKMSLHWCNHRCYGVAWLVAVTDRHLRRLSTSTSSRHTAWHRHVTSATNCRTVLTPTVTEKIIVTARVSKLSVCSDFNDFTVCCFRDTEQSPLSVS